MCIRDSLDTVSHTVKGEPRQQLLTTLLGKMVDLYTVMTYYFADAMEEVDRVAEDKGLKAVSYTHLLVLSAAVVDCACVVVSGAVVLSGLSSSAMGI